MSRMYQRLSTLRLRTTQRTVGRATLGISLRDHIKYEEIRKETNVENVIGKITEMIWAEWYL